MWSTYLCILLSFGTGINCVTTGVGFDFIYRPRDDDAPRALLTNKDGERIERVASIAFTACLFAVLEKHDRLDVVDLFSFSSKKNREINEIVLEVESVKQLTRLYINGEPADFKTFPQFGQWSHICVSWESKTGQSYLFIDGTQTQNVDNVKQGHVLGSDGYFVLGQDQDYYNGGFDADDGVHGKLTQFHLWDRVLNINEVRAVQNCSLKGNVVNWENSTWRFYGGISKCPSKSPCGSEIDRVVCNQSEIDDLRNLVIDNKMQLEKELGNAQNKINELQEKNKVIEKEVTSITDITNAVEKEIKSLQHNTVPIGFIYIQLSGQQEPSILWPNVNWIDISSSYAGLFFRVVGVNSSSFDQVQEGTCPRLDQVSVSSDQGTDNPITLQSDGSWSSFISTGASYVTTGAFRGIRFRLSRAEVRPRNRAVKIWQRRQ